MKKINFLKLRQSLGMRHLQISILFVGMIILFCIKVSMSIAIVAMTDESYINAFHWSHQTQSVILSSFEWGFILLKIPGALVASRYGGKIVMVYCAAFNSVVTLVMPTSAYLGGWKAVCLCRLLQGLAQGVLFPTIHKLIVEWAPAQEMGIIGTTLYAGAQFGTAIQLCTGGFIAHKIGWSSIFYINGAIGVLWTVLYVYFGSSSPEDSREISLEEHLYIRGGSLELSSRQKKLATPWKAMFTSLPFISLIVVNIGCSWGYWTFLTEIPTYLKHVYGVNMKANGVISALPYTVAGMMAFPFGALSDYVLKKQLISVTCCRKISNSIGTFGPALCLIIISFISSDIIAVIVLLCIGIGLNSGRYSGFHLVFIDMAPNYASTMLSITYSFANVVSIFAPLAAGFLIQNEASAHEWRKVFIMAAVMFITTNTFYLIFGTSKRQRWNEYTNKSSKGYETQKNERQQTVDMD